MTWPSCQINCRVEGGFEGIHGIRKETLISGLNWLRAVRNVSLGLSAPKAALLIVRARRRMQDEADGCVLASDQGRWSNNHDQHIRFEAKPISGGSQLFFFSELGTRNSKRDTRDSERKKSKST